MKVDKPALILEDDPFNAKALALITQEIGGFPTKHFSSIDEFEANQGLGFPLNQRKLAKVLAGYSVIICDNNFEASGGLLSGLDFLLNDLGPALSNIKESERPIVVCFSPSNTELINQKEAELWRKFQVVSFHKEYERTAIGLLLRVARDFGLTLRRQEMMESVLGLSSKVSAGGSPNAVKLSGIGLELVGDIYSKATNRQSAEGPAKPIEWNVLVEKVAKELGISEAELQGRIDNLTGEGRIRGEEHSAVKERL